MAGIAFCVPARYPPGYPDTWAVSPRRDESPDRTDRPLLPARYVRSHVRPYALR